MTVADSLNTLLPDLPVYAFNGTVYTGYHAITDANGQASFTLPQGAPSAYHFRADLNGRQYWSGLRNICEIPGCESANIEVPVGNIVTIDYTYDPLYRLTTADYSNGDAYLYIYDAVGNRLTQESMVKGITSNVGYQYDAANRLTTAGGQTYTFDANGNLLNDGVNEYCPFAEIFGQIANFQNHHIWQFS